MKAALVGVLFLVVQLGCSGGLEPGKGPGFSVFDPALTGEELYGASTKLGEIDEDELDVGESVTQDCSAGGTETLEKQSEGFHQSYSDCTKTITLRDKSYAVVINGTYHVTFQSKDNRVIGSIAQSFAGDLGFSMECESEISYDTSNGDLESHGTISCQFRDSENAELEFSAGS